MELVYIVDDEPAIRESLGAVLEDEGYQVECFPDGHAFHQRLVKNQPRLVFLDIWLPGTDGMAILSKMKADFPDIPVIMLSGHAGIESAVNSIKLGADDFLEKPLNIDVLLEKVAALLRKHDTPGDPATILHRRDKSVHRHGNEFIEFVDDDRPQCTIADNVVLNGAGLLSGRKTGIILSPLPPGEGVVFQTLDGTKINGHITCLQGYSESAAQKHFTANSTVLVRQGRYVRTVEHLLAAFSMLGITNVMVKVDEEIPNIDGSASDFCKIIRQAGVAKQDRPARVGVIYKKIGIGDERPDEKYLYLEPAVEFEIKLRVNYPAPIFEQTFVFKPGTMSFEQEIAPARSFNYFENIDMAQKSGVVGGGYLDSHIIIHDGKVINTDLRFPDEFVRHKILDLVGDLYLLGTPLRCRVNANMTSHGLNQMVVRKLFLASKATVA